MAEAMALMGAVAAAIQCAQIGALILHSGSRLCSKLNDAPDKVKIWLNQIQQLNALTDSVHEACMTLFQSLPPPSLLPSSSSVEAVSAPPWIKSALDDCSVQARTLEDLLKKMLHEVDDGKRKTIWKKILTVKRESKIVDALDHIERQKTMLNTWLCKINVSQSAVIHQSVNNIQGKLDTVSHDMLQLHHSSQKGLSDVLSATRSSSEANTHQFEELKSVIVSSFSNPERLLLENLNTLQMESAARESQSHAIVEEMRAVMTTEFKRFRKLQYQAARNPSYLKELLDVASNSQNITLVPRIRDTTKISEKIPVFGTHTVCWCRSSQWFPIFSIGRKSQLALHCRIVHTKDCAVHQWTKRSFAMSIHCRFQLLSNLMQLSFSATHGAGGSSIRHSLQTTTRVKKHFLEPFFQDIYGQRYWLRKNHRYRSERSLIEIAHKAIWRAFRSGVASPNDIDSDGRTLIHLQIYLVDRNMRLRIYPNCSEWREMDGICEQMIRLLVSMGTKTDITDDNFDTAQQKWLVNKNSFTQLIPYIGDTIFNEKLLEWNIPKVSGHLHADNMIDFMRRWPESVADFGCPYISDIVLRKSKADLELFISQGMEPVEENEWRFSPLHLAAAANWPDGVELLIAGGADKYARDDSGFFPIQYAIMVHCVRAIDLLSRSDCAPYFSGPVNRDHCATRLPILSQIVYCVDNSASLIKNIARQGSLIKTLRPFRDLTNQQLYVDDTIVVARVLYQAGFTDLDSYSEDGMTQLMAACNDDRIELATFLMEAGADTSICHRDSPLTAGHFLISSIESLDLSSQHLRSCTELLQAASDRSGVVSYCRCSPEGYSLVTSLIRSKRICCEKRERFHFLVNRLQWSGNTLEQQTRAFALGEAFNRLGMTHTCIFPGEPGRQIPEEDRLEIEEEEEELHDQLQAYMNEYDALYAEYSGCCAVHFLDIFLEKLDLDFETLGQDYCWHSKFNDKDLLGPGKPYNRCYQSYTGKFVLYGHVEEVKEVNYLSLLFDESLGNGY